MQARIRKLISDLSETFWLLPALMVMAAILLGIVLVHLDANNAVPGWLVNSPFLYNGGGTGARTLLGAVASSTIGVAGTVFSITIAALSLAAGQMGPRLLRNFTRDRGNQFTLGAFLGTFSYTLMVMRSVRTESEGTFVPYLALSVSILLAFACVAALVYFVGHIAGRINVDTVIDLVSDDMRLAIRHLTSDDPQPAEPPAEMWRGASCVVDSRCGYLQQLDGDGLAAWANARSTAVRLLVRPGDYIFPGAPVAFVQPGVEGAQAAIKAATALGATRVTTADLEFAVRQLVEVAVRALSPGINDPHTAITVVDRLGAALCDIVPVYMTSGVYVRDDHVTLVVPAVDYDGLTDTMFNMIRQNATNSTAVLIRMLEVLTIVASCERQPLRLAALRRHADLVLVDAQRCIQNRADLDDIARRHAAFATVETMGTGALSGTRR